MDNSNTKKSSSSKEFYIKHPEKYAIHRQKCLDYYNKNKIAILLKRKENRLKIKHLSDSKT